MRTRIISGFAGIGKTTFYNKNKNKCIDSDSSKFGWVYNKDGSRERNPDFPTNYIQHIKENIGKVEFILVSAHEEVRDALRDNCLFFYFIYPEINKKEDYMKRYKNRGNTDAFVKLLDENWEKWIIQCWSDIGCKRISMTLPNLEDEINHIIRSENGDQLTKEAR